MKGTTMNKTKHAILIVIIIFLSLVNLFGQIPKKTIMAGGKLDIPLKFNADGRIITNADLRIGYFPIDNIFIGGTMELEINIYGDRLTTLGTGPLIRYYIGKNRLMMFGHISYIYSTLSSTSLERNLSFSKFQPGLGLCYLISPSISLEALFGYNRYKNYDLTDYESFGFLHLGINIFFHDKKSNNFKENNRSSNIYYS